MRPLTDMERRQVEEVVKARERLGLAIDVLQTLQGRLDKQYARLGHDAFVAKHTEEGPEFPGKVTWITS